LVSDSKMKLPQISMSGAVFASLLATTSVVLAQSPTASNPSSSTTPASPLHFVSGPQNVLEAITIFAVHPQRIILPGGQIDSTAQVNAIDPQSLGIKGPLPIYNIASIAAANSLRAMTNSSGWLYFVEDAGKPIATAQIRVNSAGKTIVSNMQFTSGEPNGTTLKTLAALEQIRTGSYEVRYLRSQADGLKAIWLKPLHDGTDYVYVAPDGLYGMPGQRNGIQADKLYTLDDFIKLFLPILQERANSSGDGFG
jgi:hypothetical protein